MRYTRYYRPMPYASAPELYVGFAMFIQGHVYRRRDLHDQYGGQRQGGISTPSQYPLILLFTGESGEQHGYADGWSADGLFLYTGEGSVLDVEMAILDKQPKGIAIDE